MNSQCTPEEASLLADMKRAWAEQAHFFSNRGKAEREHWVVKEFLSRLRLSFHATELRSHPQASEVDVEFRDALFQIKEITDPNLRRGEEVSATYRRVMAAQTLQDTVGPGFVYDVPPPVNGYELLLESAEQLGNDPRYRNRKASLDLLFYVTRTRAAPVSAENVGSLEIARIGWRSVSCLFGQTATVLYAAADAPTFLREAAA
jgi:hypothetical protein